MGESLDFAVLGPLVVRRAGAVLDMGRRRQRLLLIRLLLAEGHAVAPETLCEELWPQRPGRAPDGAMASLHAHVSKVRAILEPRHLRGRRSFEVLVTEPLGYALHIPPDSRDTVRFERALAQARRSMDRGRSSRVVEETERALEMWRGAALADAAPYLFATPEAARLEELRQTARELRTAALLLDGQTQKAVDAARELTSQHPLRETGWDLLLRALYLAGRHPEALQRYTDLCRHLSDELGLDSGPSLRALHHGILRHDLPPLRSTDAANTTGTATPLAGSRNAGRPAGVEAVDDQDETASADALPAGAVHDVTRSGPTTGVTPCGTRREPDAGDGRSRSPRAVRPAQLPGDLAVFAGRETEGAWLSAVSGDPGPAGAPVVAIGGAPGVGKTTFAVHHAHQIASSFPDGQLFVNLCGFHPHAPAVEPGDALHGFLTALGVPAQDIPQDTPGRSTLFRSLLADRRILLVLDNARDEQQVRPLLPGGAGCLTLITSRNRLTGLIASEGAKPLTLALPSQSEAHETLARRLGSERLAAEPAAAADIIRLCGRLPLALAVAAAHAEYEPAFPLRTIADDLRAHSGLDAFTASDATTDVRTVFSWSYRSLDGSAARLFRLLALHPGPHVTAPAAAGLTALPLHRTRRLLADLTRSCLVEQPLPGRYTLHDLLRGYATELTHTHDDTDERHAATLRVLDHHMFTAYEANLLLKQDALPGLDLGSPGTGVVPETFATIEQARRWFTAEHRVLAGLLQTAVRQKLDRRVTGLAWTLKEHLCRQEYWPEAITALTPALEVAQRQGDRLKEARCLRGLGSIHIGLDHRRRALDHLERASALFEELGVAGEQVRALFVTAMALFRFGRHREALAPAEQGLALARSTGNQLWTAECLNGLSWLHSNMGRPEEGLVHGEEAIALYQRLDAPWQEAQCWDSVGYALHRLGRYEEAAATYRRALDAFEELEDHRNVVGSLMRRGDTRLAMGDREAARTDWVNALADAERQDLSHSAREIRDRLTVLDTDAGSVPVPPRKGVGNRTAPVPTGADSAHQSPGAEIHRR
ncbi:BTAD domain-containing putative transcriptional regulator [Streptomyces narbonensis]|uniref:BTAD domain-containing putative transcriptional regulator n=1 Tax=Streptomyces narbonensis TaxID=67333 RepID=A0ABV3CIJ7_9ACTN